ISLVVEDVVTDEDSVWAKVEITEAVRYSNGTSSTDFDQSGFFIREGGMIVYLDESTDLVDATYLYLSRGTIQENPRDPYDHEGNTLVVQSALVAFWNAEVELDRELITDMSALYAPDYQLNVQNNGGETLRIPEGQTVEEFFD